MEINVLFDDGFEHMVDAGWLREVAAAVLVAEEKSDAELGVVVTGQDRIRELNKGYRGKDGPTDVLSFAMADVTSEGPFQIGRAHV